MSNILALQAKKIIDGRGIPTIEVFLWLENQRSIVTSVPTQIEPQPEQPKIIQADRNGSHHDQGIELAIKNINEIIAPKIIGQSTINQTNIDQILVSLDGTKNKSKLGANTTLAVSQACLKAGALSAGYPLYSYLQQKYQLTEYLTTPTCIYDLINGGDLGFDNLDLEEFQLIPASYVDFPKSLDMGLNLQQQVRKIISNKGGSAAVSENGGFTPKLNSNTDVLELLIEAVKTTTYTFAQDLFFGIDANANTLSKDGKYDLRDKAGLYSTKELLDYYKNIREVYKTIYFEDPFDSKNEEAWKKITQEMGDTTRIAADNYLIDNKQKLITAIKNKSANTLVIKPLYRGTISEIVEVIKLAKDANWQIVVSHMVGETCDTFLADFAVGVGADYAKFGPLNRAERVVKYNRLLEIHHELQANSQ